MNELKATDFSLSWYQRDKMILTTKENINLFFYYKNVLLVDFTILNGYSTDGATIPKIFWSFFSPYENYFYSCLLHDYLCFLLKDTTAAEREGNSIYKLRRTIDKCLYYSMLYTGIKPFTRWIIYSFVSIYSFFAYNFITLYFLKSKIFKIVAWNEDFLQRLKVSSYDTLPQLNRSKTINLLNKLTKI